MPKPVGFPRVISSNHGFLFLSHLLTSLGFHFNSFTKICMTMWNSFHSDCPLWISV